MGMSVKSTVDVVIPAGTRVSVAADGAVTLPILVGGKYAWKQFDPGRAEDERLARVARTEEAAAEEARTVAPVEPTPAPTQPVTPVVEPVILSSDVETRAPVVEVTPEPQPIAPVEEAVVQPPETTDDMPSAPDVTPEPPTHAERDYAAEGYAFVPTSSIDDLDDLLVKHGAENVVVVDTGAWVRPRPEPRRKGRRNAE